MAKIFIKCDDAQILSTRNQYGDLNAKERFRHSLHHTHCPQCKNADRKNSQFTKAMHKLSYVRLSDSQKSKIKMALKKALGK